MLEQYQGRVMDEVVHADLISLLRWIVSVLSRVLASL